MDFSFDYSRPSTPPAYGHSYTTPTADSRYFTPISSPHRDSRRERRARRRYPRGGGLEDASTWHDDDMSWQFSTSTAWQESSTGLGAALSPWASTPAMRQLPPPGPTRSAAYRDYRHQTSPSSLFDRSRADGRLELKSHVGNANPDTSLSSYSAMFPTRGRHMPRSSLLPWDFSRTLNPLSKIAQQHQQGGGGRRRRRRRRRGGGGGGGPLVGRGRGRGEGCGRRARIF